jgi:hypothetical protein
MNNICNGTSAATGRSLVASNKKCPGSGTEQTENPRTLLAGSGFALKECEQRCGKADKCNFFSWCQSCSSDGASAGWCAGCEFKTPLESTTGNGGILPQATYSVEKSTVHRITPSASMYLYACNGLGCSVPAVVQTRVTLPPSITVLVKAMDPISDSTIAGLVDDYLGTDKVKKEYVQATYGNIEDWNVAQVTQMQNVFRDHVSFNLDIR